MTLVKFGDVITINPKEKLPKGTSAPKVAMEGIQPFTKYISSYVFEEYAGGTKFRNGDTLLARITPSLENGKTSIVSELPTDSVGFGSTEFLVFRATNQGADVKIMDRLFWHREVPHSENFSKPGFQLKTA